MDSGGASFTMVADPGQSSESATWTFVFTDGLSKNCLLSETTVIPLLEFPPSSSYIFLSFFSFTTSIRIFGLCQKKVIGNNLTLPAARGEAF